MEAMEKLEKVRGKERPIAETFDALLVPRRQALLLVTVAGEDGQPGILGKARISQRQIAQGKGGPPRRFNLARMITIATESGAA